MANKVLVTLSWFDYGLFFGMLGVSLGVGIHFGCCKNQKDAKKEYLLGGKRMEVVPIGVSLIASQISGITLLAVPADVYKFGSNYMWLCLAIPIVFLITNFVFLPLFFHLQLTSIYEYLALRFNEGIQRLASFLFVLSVFLHNPIVIYIPALVFAQATGINIDWTICIMCIICIFYTTIGGFKAVVWTDAIQFIGIVLAVIMVLVAGTSAVGGFNKVLETATRGGRLHLFDFTLDPTIRDGFWPVVVGGSVQYITYICFNQGNMQKYLAVPTLAKSRRALLIFCFGVVGIIFSCVFTGNVLYTRYHNCDPITTKQIDRDDQLLFFYVLELAKTTPGLVGIFIAGIFSAALSTLSSSLNTIAAAIYEDFVLPYTKVFERRNTESCALKTIVLISGIVCTVMALFVDRIRGVLSFSIALNSIASGPMLGLFVLGIFFPKANAKGAFYGCIAGLVVLSSIVFGNQWYNNHHYGRRFVLPLETSGCNVTVAHVDRKDHYMAPPFILYKLSFWYNSLVGAVVVIVVGLIVSQFTKSAYAAPDRRLGYSYELLGK